MKWDNWCFTTVFPKPYFGMVLAAPHEGSGLLPVRRKCVAQRVLRFVSGRRRIAAMQALSAMRFGTEPHDQKINEAADLCR